MNFFQKIKEKISSAAEAVTQTFKTGLSKTSEQLVKRVEALFFRNSKIDEGFFEELEEILIMADVGVQTTLQVIEAMRKEAKQRRLTNSIELKPVLVEYLLGLFPEQLDQTIIYAKSGPTVIVYVGVNGVGKTTTIAKMAHRFKLEGKRVMVAAGDTFRAAAVEQLDIWANRVGVPIVKHEQGSDPSAVVFDAIRSAKLQNIDVLMIDTAGRLQNKANLMEELNKMVRVIQREIPDGPHEVLMVLDSTTGQNALSQAKLFGEKSGVTGLVLTKLDGTAKGGIVIAIRRELNLPVKYVGLGEKAEDLQPFDREQFIHALFGEWMVNIPSD